MTASAAILYLNDPFRQLKGRRLATNLEKGHDEEVDPSEYGLKAIRVYNGGENSRVILNGTFRAFNAVDGDELCCQLRIRSMSVGDIVRIQHGDGGVPRYYMVLAAGFDFLSPDRAAQFEQHFFPQGLASVERSLFLTEEESF